MSVRGGVGINAGRVEQPDGSHRYEIQASAGAFVSAFSGSVSFDIPFINVTVEFTGHLASVGAYARLDLREGFEIRAAKAVGGAIRLSWGGSEEEDDEDYS